jgi:hypothetical protein
MMKAFAYPVDFEVKLSSEKIFKLNKITMMG